MPYGTDVNKKTRIYIQHKSDVRQKYRCRQRASILCFIYMPSSYMLCLLLLKACIR